jgi:hypothetical protein
MIRRTLLLAAAGLFLAGARLAGQAAPDLISQGQQAYRTLEFEYAAALLKRGLAGNASATMPDSVRSDAYLYLGASELMRGRKDLAEAAFRQALAVEPRFRPDSLIFPPQITDAFEQVRRNTAYVKVRAPRDTTITYGAEHYVVRLYSSARHEGTVEIASGTGRAKRIYAGPITDSMDVRWEGADLTGRAPLTGPAFLQVISREQGRARTVRVPLTIQAVRPDTLPLPQRPNLAPIGGQSGGPSNRALGALGLGILGGAAAIMLPEVIASDGAGGSARYYIGGSLAFAGLLGFAVQQNRSSAAVSAATADRAAARDAWSRRVDSVRAENARIRRDLRLRITTTGGSAERGGEGEAP